MGTKPESIAEAYGGE